MSKKHKVEQRRASSFRHVFRVLGGSGEGEIEKTIFSSDFQRSLAKVPHVVASRDAGYKRDLGRGKAGSGESMEALAVAFEGDIKKLKSKIQHTTVANLFELLDFLTIQAACHGYHDFVNAMEHPAPVRGFQHVTSLWSAAQTAPSAELVAARQCATKEYESISNARTAVIAITGALGVEPPNPDPLKHKLVRYINQVTRSQKLSAPVVADVIYQAALNCSAPTDLKFFKDQVAELYAQIDNPRLFVNYKNTLTGLILTRSLLTNTAENIFSALKGEVARLLLEAHITDFYKPEASNPAAFQDLVFDTVYRRCNHEVRDRVLEACPEGTPKLELTRRILAEAVILPNFERSFHRCKEDLTKSLPARDASLVVKRFADKQDTSETERVSHNLARLHQVRTLTVGGLVAAGLYATGGRAAFDMSTTDIDDATTNFDL
jgi:hypothetical protein